MIAIYECEKRTQSVSCCL